MKILTFAVLGLALLIGLGLAVFASGTCSHTSGIERCGQAFRLIGAGFVVWAIAVVWAVVARWRRRGRNQPPGSAP